MKASWRVAQNSDPERSKNAPGRKNTDELEPLPMTQRMTLS